MESEIQKLSELLLRQRLRELARELKEREKDIKKNEARGTVFGDQLALGQLIDAWAEALQRHCHRTLRDLLSVLKILDVLPSAEWLQLRFESHIDEAISELLRRVTTDHLSGNSPAERNRITNKVAGVKSRAKHDLEKEVERAIEIKEREVAVSFESSPSELDDRLPLNRRAAFDRDLVEMVQKVKRIDAPLSLAMIDLDHFKRVNDQHGHPVGDEVLMAISEIVIKRLANKGKAYRYGGEEISLLLPGYSAEEAAGLAERIRKDIEGEAVSSKELRVTASFGVACVPDHGTSPKDLLERADEALYDAKNLGRNCVRVYGEQEPERTCGPASR